MKIECLLFIPTFFGTFAHAQPITKPKHTKVGLSADTINSNILVRFPMYINDSNPTNNRSLPWTTYALPVTNDNIPTQNRSPVDEDGYVNCGFPDFIRNFEDNEDKEKDIQLSKINEKCPTTSGTSNNFSTCDPELDIEKRKEILGFHVPENTTHLEGRIKFFISLANN